MEATTINKQQEQPKTAFQQNIEELPHQQRALKDIFEAFPNLDTFSSKDLLGNSNHVTNTTANPLLTNAYISQTIDGKTEILPNTNQFIDVQMETGTGKTYVYNSLMYLLHQRRKFFKFIVVVPGVAIKEGALDTLKNKGYIDHFKNIYGNQVNVRTYTISSGDFGSKDAKRIPTAIQEFLSANSNDKNTIHVLVMHDKGYLNSKNSSQLFKQNLIAGGFFASNESIIEQLSHQRPVVIIDEPHKFNPGKETLVNIINEVKPQMIIRFGATFPLVGKGKNKTPHFFRGTPQHQLTTVDAFNDHLIKNIKVVIPEGNDRSKTYRVVKANSKELELKQGGNTIIVLDNQSLNEVDSSFPASAIYDGISKNFSFTKDSGQKLEVGQRINPESLMTNYQEVMMNAALDQHFATERENFVGRTNKIKTNALFFIESRASYRLGDKWLMFSFERLLKRKLEQLIPNENNSEYKDYLQYTLDHIEDAQGGYFSGDANAKKEDDKIAQQVDTILRDKSLSLQFKDENNNWLVRRFFFSQWALQEGWDNPNVFTLVKLRSSPSETSLIQELGRGLRLPVDEFGNRLTDEIYLLNYVINQGENDFAQRFVDDVNSNSAVVVNGQSISESVINQLIELKYASNKLQVKIKLAEENIIDDDEQIIDAFALNKLLQKTLNKDAVQNEDGTTPSGSKATLSVKLNKRNWQTIRDQWLAISKRFFLSIDNIDNEKLSSWLQEVVYSNVWNDNQSVTVTVQEQQTTDVNGDITTSFGSQSTFQTKNTQDLNHIDYGVFIQNLYDVIHVPIKIIQVVINKKLIALSNQNKSVNVNNYLNGHTIQSIIARWEELLISKQVKYKYDALNYHLETSVLNEDTSFKDSVPVNWLGKSSNEVSIDETEKRRTLFEKTYADSGIEEAIAGYYPDEKIRVFGKIPQRAIKIPRLTGGTTTPDFLYYQDNQLLALVDSKGESLRNSEVDAIQAQKQFFKDNHIDYEMVKSVQDVQNLLGKMGSVE